MATAAPSETALGGMAPRPFRVVSRRPETRDTWTLDRPPYFLESSQPGVFVAGDVRHGSVKRVASAVGEGAFAIALVHRFLALRDEA